MWQLIIGTLIYRQTSTGCNTTGAGGAGHKDEGLGRKSQLRQFLLEIPISIASSTYNMQQLQQKEYKGQDEQN